MASATLSHEVTSSALATTAGTKEVNFKPSGSLGDVDAQPGCSFLNFDGLIQPHHLPANQHLSCQSCETLYGNVRELVVRNVFFKRFTWYLWKNKPISAARQKFRF